jgi:HSP20 family protein
MRSYPYNILVRDFAEMAGILNRALEGAPYNYAQGGGNAGETEPETSAVRLPIDVWTSEDAYMISAYIPGVNPEEVEIAFEGNVLTIRGRFAPLPEGAEFQKNELYHGAFHRNVRIRVPVDAEAIDATYEHGVLTLRLPKAEASKSKQIKVVAK